MLEKPNPFWPTKFEEEELPLVYLSDEARKQFRKNNLYFTGKRGCGKTTCLKIADTSFQLRLAPKSDDSREVVTHNYFGVYSNMNCRTIPSFTKIPPTKLNKFIVRSPEALTQLRFEFIELSLLRTAISALSRLVSSSHFSLSIDGEKKAISALEEAYEIGPVGSSIECVHKIEDRLRQLIDFSRGVIEELPKYKARLEIPFHDVAGTLVGALRESNDIEFLRFLIDDCEVFSSEYQKVINTLVRAPQGTPIAWSVAYVQGKYNPKDTHINNQTAAREERNVVYLDRQRQSSYRKFIEGVVNLRIGRALTKKTINFDIAAKLSSFEINRLAQASFAQTKNKSALKFVDRAQTFDPSSRDPKFYELFLEEQRIQVHSDDARRRKNVAAYVALCAHYGVHVKYAGESIVMALSDGCIRDFLETIAAIYECHVKSGRTVDDFFSDSLIPIEIQDEGCKEAALRKLNSIQDYTEANGLVLEKLVLCLGHLVRMVQSGNRIGNSKDHLLNPERAIFSIRVRDRGLASEELALIQSGEVDGYIRHVESKAAADGSYCFRLHRQFSPKFEYSYREAPDKLIPLTSYRLREIRENIELDPEKWAEKVLRDWQPGQETLPYDN